MVRLLCSLWLLWCLAAPARAEDPVYFADPNLKAAVEAELWISDPTPTDLLGLTFLRAEFRGISDLTGLENAVNLQEVQLACNRIRDISVVTLLTNLQTLVLNNNDVSDLSPVSGLTCLRKLDVHNNLLSDISAVSGLVNLHTLVLRINQISDLSALSALTQLETLILRNNQISDLSPLSSLTKLQYLQLAHNQISDISALSGLTQLRTLILTNNQIGDISPLVGLMSLQRLDLQGNPLNEEAYDICIAQIIENNPGIAFDYEFTLWTSSTAGGSVMLPGEGAFGYRSDEVVLVQAQAEPGFVFTTWSGSHWSKMNPIEVTMDQNHRLEAHFAKVPDVVYVDDDAPDDAGAGDATVSDPQEDGTVSHPFDSIQEAIDVAGQGTSIIVRPGTYREQIDFLGKRIQLIGIDPNDPTVAALPVIEGAGTAAAVTFAGGEDLDSVLMGFVLANGSGGQVGGIYCRGSSPTIANCLIAGNRSAHPDGAAVYCIDSEALLVNCTIADNVGAERSTGIYLLDSHVVLMNSIIWGNVPNEIVVWGTGELTLASSDVAGGWPGLGNIDADPLFVRRGRWANPNDPNGAVEPDAAGAIWIEGDYHLTSAAGRWNPQTHTWVEDETTSPCIDAGDPTMPVGDEPVPNGGTINLGAYGGTSQAGKSQLTP